MEETSRCEKSDEKESDKNPDLEVLLFDMTPREKIQKENTLNTMCRTLEKVHLTPVDVD
jgi:hypothetical protein